MQTLNCVSMPLNLKGKSSIFGLLIAALLICGIYFTGSAFLTRDFRMLSFGTEVNQTRQVVQSDKCKISLSEEMNNTRKNMTQGDKCKKQYRAVGSEPLPEGIVAPTTNLEMRPLYGPIVENVGSECLIFKSFPQKIEGENVTLRRNLKEEINTKTAVNLLAIAVGVKQKELVNQMVRKFLDNGFVVMLFHYDLAVDDWNDLEWSSRVIHVSAMNQTKWWFAKRFLHPDIVADYDYIFLWDEDFGVENFHPGRYVSIIKEEGLEISQPALDRRKSGVHHEITKRKRNLKVHRRIIKKGHVACDGNSTSPPCTGWVEMMAPVFSRAAWRCAWYMIQNDLIHAWGLDIQLGYCAQGDRTKNVGVVDAEYIVHLGVPSLGALGQDKVPSSNIATIRAEVRRQSYYEMDIFRERWKRAVEKDKCWIDPYLKPLQQKKQ